MRWTAFVCVAMCAAPRHAARAALHAGAVLLLTVLLVALPPAAAARVHALPAAASIPAAGGAAASPAPSGSELPRITVRGGRLYAGSAPFRAWGFGWGAGDHMPTLAYLDDPTAANYQTLAGELQTAKDMGANSMRVYVELSEVMSGPTSVRQDTLTALQNLLSLAASDGIYLDITGDLVWRVNLSPDWYEQMSDGARWQAQARFWHAVAHAAAASPAVLCYELTSEPIISDTATRYFGQTGNWWFVQSMARGNGQDDAQLARSWTQTMALAVRAEDDRPVTIGMLPTLDGAFAPSNVASYLDLLTVHDYPQTGQAAAAVALVNAFGGYGKPVLLGETGFLGDDLPTQQQFLLGVAARVVGELEFFDGRDPRTMLVTSISDAVVKDGLDQFMALRAAILAGDATVPPGFTTITSGPWGATSSADATFSFASSESGATFECRLDGPGITIGSFAPCTSPHTYSGLGDGLYTFVVRAVDAAANADPNPATRGFTVDTHAPAPPVIATPADGTYNTTRTVVLSGSAEPNSTVSITDGVTAVGTTTADGGGNWTKTMKSLTDGVHAFSASAIDAASRASEPSSITHVTVDTHAPHTSILTGPTGSTTQTKVSFEFTSSEQGSASECTLSGPGRPAAFARCTSPVRFAGLRPGSYVFAVRAVDDAGNRDPHPATRSFSIVGTPSTRHRLTALSLTPSTLTPAPSGPTLTNHTPTHGSLLKFTLARSGAVRFTVQKQALGRRTPGGRCGASRSVRRTRRCSFFETLRGGVVIAGKRGLNRIWFTGRVSGNRLVNGSYKLVASPVGSRPAEVRFRIQR